MHCDSSMTFSTFSKIASRMLFLWRIFSKMFTVTIVYLCTSHTKGRYLYMDVQHLVALVVVVIAFDKLNVFMHIYSIKFFIIHASLSFTTIFFSFSIQEFWSLIWIHKIFVNVQNIKLNFEIDIVNVNIEICLRVFQENWILKAFYA